MENHKPLEGVKILDLGEIGAGPIGPTLLAEFGAEVIKVELPGEGNFLRKIPHFYQGTSLWWAIEGRNKRSITVDMRTPQGQEIIRRLVERCDVVSENYRPGTMERWNLGYEELKKIQEDLVMVRVTGFGQSGPYRRRVSGDTIGAAMGGIIYLTGHPEAPPTRPGFLVCDYISAAFNALAILIALYHRGRTGQGQWAEVAQYEAILRIAEFNVAAYDKLGLLRERTGNRHPSFAPYDLFLTKDGRWMAIAAGDDKGFGRLARAMGREELLDDPRFATPARRAENGEQINRLVADWVREYPLEQAWEILVAAGVAAGPVYSAREVVEDPHHRVRGNLVEIDDPAMGRIRVPDVVPRLSRTPGAVRGLGPALGEHTEEVLRELGYSPEEIAALREAGVIEPRPVAGAKGQERRPSEREEGPPRPASQGEGRPQALAGLRVLDLGWGLAGAFGATLLADFGAEVIKVEEPGRGDLLRHLPPFCDGASLWWAVEGRNKKSLTLDLRKERGQEIFQALVKESDVVIESFRPGTLERWGLGYQELKRANERVILVRVSGFGQSGPYRDRLSYEAIASAMAGLTSVTGQPEGPPTRPGLAVAAYQAGVFAALGVLMALYHRDIRGSGEGQWIDLALYDSLVRFCNCTVSAYDKLGIIEERSGNRFSMIGPADLFLTRDRRWIVILAADDQHFARLARAMGREELSHDPRFARILNRTENREAINEIVRQWAEGHTLEELVKVLEENEVFFSPVCSTQDLFEDPHCRARGNLIEVEDPLLGRVRMQDVVPKFALTPGRIERCGPRLGEHTGEILSGLLGYGREEIARLQKEKVI